MLCEWDGTKASDNLAKHGLDFSDAEQVPAGRCVTFPDDRFDYGEERFISIGLLAGRGVVIVHAPRGVATRIVSMRKANQREQEICKKRLGEA